MTRLRKTTGWVITAVIQTECLVNINPFYRPHNLPWSLNSNCTMKESNFRYTACASGRLINPYPANVENKVSYNASKWQMGFNLAFKGLNKLWINKINIVLPVSKRDVVQTLVLTLILLTWSIGWAPNNASKWQMGFNWAFKVLHSNCCLELRGF